MKTLSKVFALSISFLSASAFAAGTDTVTTSVPAFRVAVEKAVSHESPPSHLVQDLFKNVKGYDPKANYDYKLTLNQMVSANSQSVKMPLHGYVFMLGDVINYSQPIKHKGFYQLVVTAYQGQKVFAKAIVPIQVSPISQQTVKVTRLN